jgi:hypothetical protein
MRGTGEKTDVKWNLLRNLKKEYNIFRPAPRHYIKCISPWLSYRFKITKVDDGLIVKLNPVVQYKYIPTNLFTVLPSPRKSKHYFFCNEKFYTFMIMTLF